MTFMTGASMRLEETSQLVRLGLMRETDAWVDERSKSSPSRAIE
jgi:hypothetical protein